jgi:hypothetical protein
MSMGGALMYSSAWERDANSVYGVTSIRVMQSLLAIWRSMPRAAGGQRHMKLHKTLNQQEPHMKESSKAY